jgi:putative ABC transport system substrate-binding protein
VNDPAYGSQPLFLRALAELGYEVGRDIVLEGRNAHDQYGQLPELAGELVRLPVDVIVADSTPSVIAARHATSTIPIVVLGGNPVRLGLAPSFARPDGNLTGISEMSAELSGKRLQLLKEAFRSTTQVGVLWDPDAESVALQWEVLRDAAPVVGVELQSLAVRTPGDIDGALDTTIRAPVDALLVIHSSPIFARRERVLAFAAQRGLPAMYTQRPWVQAGGLMTYTASREERHRRAAYYVDRILKGAKPADLPVEQPMTFDFLVNLKTAQTLGVTFPNEILLQVTEVIQ